MKIGLVDVDGHRFPNLALMKISNYHKQIGNSVEWYSIFENFDIVYMSKIFTFTPDYQYPIKAKKIFKGGTGYDIHSKLPDEIENCNPDYSLYPINNWYDGKTSYGFLTRGCVRDCSWCVVPKKEGKIKPNQTIENLLGNNKKAVIMDNNILACEYGLEQIKRITELGCKVDFNQGLDARLIFNNKTIQKLLTKVKYLQPLRLACDTQKMKPYVKYVVTQLREYGIKPTRLFCYVLLTNDIKECLDRINFCKELNIDPFAQPYRDFTPNQIIPQWQKDMAHWCNKKSLFKSTSFEDFEPRVGFKCKKYFSYD